MHCIVMGSKAHVADIALLRAFMTRLQVVFVPLLLRGSRLLCLGLGSLLPHAN